MPSNSSSVKLCVPPFSWTWHAALQHGLAFSSLEWSNWSAPPHKAVPAWGPYGPPAVAASEPSCGHANGGSLANVGPQPATSLHWSVAIMKPWRSMRHHETNQGNQTWAVVQKPQESSCCPIAKQPICQVQSFLGPFLRPFLGGELVPLSIPATQTQFQCQKCLRRLVLGIWFPHLIYINIAQICANTFLTFDYGSALILIQ